MTKRQYEAYLNSDDWNRRAYAAKWRAGFRCQVCNSEGQLDAHHRTYERVGNERADDLIALCRACHDLYELRRRRITSPARWPWTGDFCDEGLALMANGVETLIIVTRPLAGERLARIYAVAASEPATSVVELFSAMGA